jgi:RNA polymerase-binding transcription factor DksA
MPHYTIANRLQLTQVLLAEVDAAHPRPFNLLGCGVPCCRKRGNAMSNSVFDRVRTSLVTQRQNLAAWLDSTPNQAKQLRLGPAGEEAVQAHLQVLDTALERAADHTLGLCEVCHDYVEPSRLEMDYTACVCIDHLADEERRRLESDLELSQKVQQALLPQQVPDIPGLELAAFSQPARIVGGDYFDFLRFRDNTHGLVIADVVDKGMAASLLMASLQASLRILVGESNSPAQVVKRLNSLFIHNIHLTQFVTLFLARYDHLTRTLHYCNAGHNQPLLYRQLAGDKRQGYWLQPTGPAIGLVEEFIFHDETAALLPGDTLLLYTDGVTEARNVQGAEFKPQGLIDFMQQHALSRAPDLVRDLRRELQEFTGGQPLADDTTIVVGKLTT